MYELLLKLCQSKGITITNLCIEVTGSPGNLSTWKKGNINPTSLTKIADYFNVSADYLLGRTTSSSEISGNHISGNSNNGNNSIRVGAVPDGIQDNFIAEFLKRFEKLDFDDKLEIMNLTSQKLKKSA